MDLLAVLEHLKGTKDTSVTWVLLLNPESLRWHINVGAFVRSGKM